MRGRFTNIRSLLTTLGIALLMFSLCRLFFLLFNLTYFRDYSVLVFFHGLRFDLAALVIVFSPYIFLHLLPHPWRTNRYFLAGMKGLFHSLNTAAMAFNCMDIEYFKFTFKRTTFDFFDLVGYGQDVYILMPRFLRDYWYVIALWIGMILLSEWLYRKVNRADNGITGTMAYLREASVLLLVVPLSVLIARGGWQLKPLSIIHAGAHTEARNVPLVLNTPFTLLNTWNKQQLADRQYFREAEANQRFNPVIRLAQEAPFDRKNVVLIIMESFSREYIGSLNNYPGYTPFLDSLIGESLVFNQCYANGKKSIEGVPSILAGLPSLMNNPYISSIYSANSVNSLASLLKAEGYQTAFYHGGTNGTMGFDNFAAAAGFDRYVGRAEYNNEDHYDGNWGIFDEPFLQFFAEEMAATETPFFTTFFSLSSHHPFTIPEQHRGKFAEGPLPILKTVRYADYSLREFFRTARTQSWYANTLFVITADHTAEPIYPHYNTTVGNYAVPLIFFTPSGALRGRNNRITQQADIMPSVLDHLHYAKPFVAFGQSVFQPADEGFAVSYINDVYQVIRDPYVVRFDGETGTGVFNWREDVMLKNDLRGQHLPAAREAEAHLKAYIQQYEHRMIRNQLTLE